MLDATTEAPIRLSRRQTFDAVQSIASTASISARKSKALLMATLPDSTFPTFVEATRERAFIDDTTRMILSLDGPEELNIISDMRYFNCRGNTDQSKYEVFFQAAARVLEKENGSGAH